MTQQPRPRESYRYIAAKVHRQQIQRVSGKRHRWDIVELYEDPAPRSQCMTNMVLRRCRKCGLYQTKPAHLPPNLKYTLNHFDNPRDPDYDWSLSLRALPACDP